jgi:hypothetical protein
MIGKRLLEAGFGLCTVGGAFFALGAAKDSLAAIVEFPGTVYYVFLLVGGILTVTGLAAVGAAFFLDRIAFVVAHVVYGDVDAKYVCGHASANDLPGLHVLYTKHFGNDVPSLPTMHAWLARCASTFTIIHRVAQDAGLITQQELVGSYKLVPLTRSGVRAVELGQVTGTTLKTEHISRDAIRASGYYIGDVVATTRFARGVVVAHLNAAISTATRGHIAVYARPLTADGLRVMTKHGFIQVADGRSAPEIGKICKLEIRGSANRLARLRSGHVATMRRRCGR